MPSGLKRKRRSERGREAKKNKDKDAKDNAKETKRGPGRPGRPPGRGKRLGRPPGSGNRDRDTSTSPYAAGSSTAQRRLERQAKEKLKERERERQEDRANSRDMVTPVTPAPVAQVSMNSGWKGRPPGSARGRKPKVVVGREVRGSQFAIRVEQDPSKLGHMTRVIQKKMKEEYNQRMQSEQNPKVADTKTPENREEEEEQIKQAQIVAQIAELRQNIEEKSKSIDQQERVLRDLNEKRRRLYWLLKQVVHVEETGTFNSSSIR